MRHRSSALGCAPQKDAGVQAQLAITAHTLSNIHFHHCACTCDLSISALLPGARSFPRSYIIPLRSEDSLHDISFLLRLSPLALWELHYDNSLLSRPSQQTQAKVHHVTELWHALGLVDVMHCDSRYFKFPMFVGTNSIVSQSCTLTTQHTVGHGLQLLDHEADGRTVASVAAQQPRKDGATPSQPGAKVQNFK